MNAPARSFTAALAVREQVPLLIGLMGPSGGGKTFSALRLATGIQRISGGDIFMIDTEARRGLHYADQFKFRHVPFEEPFGSLDYLAALRFCVRQGAGVVIVDSMSHEHEGVGGLLDFHEAELTRMAGDNYGKREAMKMLAWGKPKAARRQLINGLLQMNTNFIFCFRAKNTVKPVKVTDDQGRSRTEVIPQGFMPIAGDEFVFEMTTNMLLLPGANGVPTWQTDNVGERTMMKLPAQFRDLMHTPRALDEQMGMDLATWARGGAPTGDPGDFPGDRPSRPAHPANGQTTPLPDRIQSYFDRMAAAPNPLKATALWNAAEHLRADVDRSAPDRLIAMREAYDAKVASFGSPHSEGNSQ